MAKNRKKEFSSPSLIEAVETLSTIADLEIESGVAVATKENVTIQKRALSYHTVHWLKEGNAKEALRSIRQTFGVVLRYLHRFYEQEYRRLRNREAMEEIKTIMVLVGEAAKKLDYFDKLFEKTKIKSVTELKEYRQLQDFYLTRIARKIDEGLLGKWILGLTKEAFKAKGKPRAITHFPDTKQLFINLDSVKRDTDYELFYIRKEDGSRFFSPRLIRNIKLICDFGYYFGEQTAKDPLLHTKFWNDLMLHESAHDLLKVVRDKADLFWQNRRPRKQGALVSSLSKALIALMMSANPRNLLRNQPVKSCGAYFSDFLFFLSEALSSRQYQKMLLYSTQTADRLSQLTFELLLSLSKGLYCHLKALQQLTVVIQEMIEDACANYSADKEESSLLSHRLTREYAAMRQWLGSHPNGPLSKALETLQPGKRLLFSPFSLNNLPNRLTQIEWNGHRIIQLKVPSPTNQEQIGKAAPSEIFKNFILSLAKEGKRSSHLLFNLQDRTSWRGHARCILLEDLQHLQGFKNHLTVVTLSKDSDFYHQLAPYHQENKASHFIEMFLDQLKDENCGFYFPKGIRSKILPTFAKKLMHTIHTLFFFKKNVLTRQQRLDFIELFYFFLELKILEIVQPTSFSLTCKDSIDTGGAATATFYANLKLIGEDPIEEQDREHLNLLFYATPLLLRERLMIADRFNRSLSAIRAIESCIEEMGKEIFIKELKNKLSQLFKNQTLSPILFPQRL